MVQILNKWISLSSFKVRNNHVTLLNHLTLKFKSFLSLNFNNASIWTHPTFTRNMTMLITIITTKDEPPTAVGEGEGSGRNQRQSVWVSAFRTLGMFLFFLFLFLFTNGLFRLPTYRTENYNFDERPTPTLTATSQPTSVPWPRNRWNKGWTYNEEH